MPEELAGLVIKQGEPPKTMSNKENINNKNVDNSAIERTKNQNHPSLKKQKGDVDVEKTHNVIVKQKEKQHLTYT